jgi:hypothetical protein
LCIPGFEQRRGVACQGDVLSADDHMVVAVAPTRQPDSAVDHRQPAGPGFDAHDLFAQQPKMAIDRGARHDQSLLHFHHQSPGPLVTAIIDDGDNRIQ